MSRPESPSADAGPISRARPTVLTVLAVACRVGDVIASLPRPARHHDIIHALAGVSEGLGRVPPRDQGFLLSDGSYADRRRALAVAQAAGQLVLNPSAGRSPISPPNLFSEDLW